jgi:membrane protein insertase Oxa1/YidC/SpoIIIJ
MRDNPAGYPGTCGSLACFTKCPAFRGFQRRFLENRSSRTTLFEYNETELAMLYTVIIFPLVQIMELCYLFVYRIFDNPGIALFGVSIAVSALTLPLYFRAERWQQIERETQKRLALKTAKIKAVFTGDEQYMILSTYYRQNHYHPVYALRNTFGLLVQIPFFIAAYSCLSRLEILRGSSFLFIRDLGAPDALLQTGA